MKSIHRGEQQERLAESLAKAFDGGAADYEVSEAFAEPERRKFLGQWTVWSHLVGEVSYVERFAAHAVKGGTLRDPSYWSSYTFRSRTCVKHVEIEGFVDGPEGPSSYAYKLGVALAWEPCAGGHFRAHPELGYLATFLDGAPVAVKELEDLGQDILIAYAFEGGELRLVEDLDVKILRRIR